MIDLYDGYWEEVKFKDIAVNNGCLQIKENLKPNGKIELTEHVVYKIEKPVHVRDFDLVKTYNACYLDDKQRKVYVHVSDECTVYTNKHFHLRLH